MQRTSPASYNSVDRAVEGETRAGLSSALRPTRLLAFRRYTWHEHALWGHAPIFLSRASNARCGESPHALLSASVSSATASPSRSSGR